MISRVLKRVFSYNGSMEFQEFSDEVVEANYQHKYVVDKFLCCIEDRKVLDAGCWTGPIEKEISERGIGVELVGIDENRSALSVATKNFPKFKFVECKLTEPSKGFISEHEEYFDTVIFLDVIEHLPKGSEVNVLKFFNKILKPGGKLIFSTMASHPLNFIDPAWFFGHRHYSVKSIEKILESSKFKANEVLQIGNLSWDIDLLLFYIYKHIFRREYRMSDNMYKKIMRGFDSPKIATRIYVLATKNEKK